MPKAKHFRLRVSRSGARFGTANQQQNNSEAQDPETARARSVQDGRIPIPWDAIACGSFRAGIILVPLRYYQCSPTASLTVDIDDCQVEAVILGKLLRAP